MKLCAKVFLWVLISYALYCEAIIPLVAMGLAAVIGGGVVAGGYFAGKAVVKGGVDSANDAMKERIQQMMKEAQKVRSDFSDDLGKQIDRGKVIFAEQQESIRNTGKSLLVQANDIASGQQRLLTENADYLLNVIDKKAQSTIKLASSEVSNLVKETGHEVRNLIDHSANAVSGLMDEANRNLKDLVDHSVLQTKTAALEVANCVIDKAKVASEELIGCAEDSIRRMASDSFGALSQAGNNMAIKAMSNLIWMKKAFSFKLYSFGSSPSIRLSDRKIILENAPSSYVPLNVEYRIECRAQGTDGISHEIVFSDMFVISNPSFTMASGTFSGVSGYIRFATLFAAGVAFDRVRVSLNELGIPQWQCLVIARTDYSTLLTFAEFDSTKAPEGLLNHGKEYALAIINDIQNCFSKSWRNRIEGYDFEEAIVLSNVDKQRLFRFYFNGDDVEPEFPRFSAIRGARTIANAITYGRELFVGDVVISEGGLYSMEVGNSSLAVIDRRYGQMGIVIEEIVFDLNAPVVRVLPAGTGEVKVEHLREGKSVWKNYKLRLPFLCSGPVLGFTNHFIERFALSHSANNLLLESSELPSYEMSNLITAVDEESDPEMVSSEVIRNEIAPLLEEAFKYINGVSEMMYHSLNEFSLWFSYYKSPGDEFDDEESIEFIESKLIRFIYLFHHAQPYFNQYREKAKAAIDKSRNAIVNEGMTGNKQVRIILDYFSSIDNLLYSCNNFLGVKSLEDIKKKLESPSSRKRYIERLASSVEKCVQRGN